MTNRLLALYRGNREEFWRIFRYLAVGGWNTLFGIGVYTLLFELLKGRAHYLALAVPSNILAVTNAYVCYKLIVFKTKGNIIREYLRCYLVYGVSMLFGMAGLWLLVDGFGFYPVWGNILVAGITVIVSYVGHRVFSFRPRSMV